ncbi:MAG: type I-E CRISPR-associated protein Cse2/CasB [Burkholderiales bacterium]|nr:type I-E CRISPR-associated protein Cse2/CasB [Burkholderiales bacterium]
MTEALSEVTDTATGSSLGARVAQMAAIIGAEHYPNGERAALRRWSLEQPIPLAFYRLWLRHLGDDLPPEFQTPAWMTIAWGLATLGKEGHDPRRPLGQALAESQFSEGRLEQLLSAPEDVRPDLFMSAVRFLAAKGERFDWRDGAAFLLTQDNEQRQRLNHRIAAAFYRHQTQN